MITRARVDERLRTRGLEGAWAGSPPAAFAALRIDSRSVHSGDLFCAIRGARLDGHAFLDDAARAGAAGAVVEDSSLPSTLPLRRVADSRAAAAHLGALFAGDPQERLDVVGVTGTNGKTTTVLLVQHLLSVLGPAGAVGTLGMVRPGGRPEGGRLTTPDPVELARCLAELEAAGARRVAIEVSSHSLDQRRADAVPFAVAVFTNLTRDHLDYHRDMQRYRGAKLRLATLRRPGGTAAVNADDPAWDDVECAPPVVRFGLSESAEVRAKDLRLDPGGSRWRLVAPEGEADVRLPLLGAFNVSNALAAATAARALGLDIGRIAEGLSGAPQVPGRMEVLAREPALVVRDYAHTPDALARALEALRPLARARLLVLFGCGGDRDPGKRPLMGRVGVEGSDHAIVTSDNPRTEDPRAIVDQIVADLETGSWEVVVDRVAAIRRALEIAGDGDVVLLAGKGHETYQEVDGERMPFDEKRIVAGLLAAGTETRRGAGAGGGS